MKTVLSDRDPFAYEVRLRPDEVCAQVGSFIGREKLFFEDDKEFVGSVTSSRFEIRMTTGYGRNSFRPYLHGRIEPRPDGSRIVVWVGLNSFTRAGMTLWLAMTIGFSALSLLAYLAGEMDRPGPHTADPRLALLAPPGMFAGGVILVWLGRLWYRSDERRLLAFADRLWGPRRT